MDDDLRASAAERNATAGKLHAHAASGRLSAAELSGRLEQARLARTRAGLAALLADLPAFRAAPVQPPELRVSDAERDTTAAALQAHYLSGRLSRDEYDERLEIALIAVTYRELHSVLSDLPAPRIPAAPVTTARAGKRSSCGLVAAGAGLTLLAVAGVGTAITPGSPGTTAPGPSPAVSAAPAAAGGLSCAALAPDLAAYVTWQQGNPVSWAVPSLILKAFLAATVSAGNGDSASAGGSSLPDAAGMFRWDMLNGNASVAAADLAAMDTDCGGNP